MFKCMENVTVEKHQTGNSTYILELIWFNNIVGLEKRGKALDLGLSRIFHFLKRQVIFI